MATDELIEVAVTRKMVRAGMRSVAATSGSKQNI
jgi:hypothetical protein